MNPEKVKALFQRELLDLSEDVFTFLKFVFIQKLFKSKLIWSDRIYAYDVTFSKKLLYIYVNETMKSLLFIYFFKLFFYSLL